MFNYGIESCSGRQQPTEFLQFSDDLSEGIKISLKGLGLGGISNFQLDSHRVADKSSGSGNNSIEEIGKSQKVDKLSDGLTADSLNS